MTETTITREAQGRKLKQVQALLLKAQDPATPEVERDNILENVDRLMRRYNIDEEMLRESGTEVQEPTSETFRMYEKYHRWTQEMGSIMRAVARFAGVRIHGTTREVQMVGFPADIAYAQSLFATIQMTLLQKMDPRWESFRTEDENVTALYEAGWKWRHIAEVGGFPWPDGGKLIRAYKRQCKREGREPITVQRKDAYRESFVESFSERIRVRLITIEYQREETDKAAELESGMSSSLVLASRAERVDTAFYSLLPDLHPDAVRRRNAETMARLEKEIADEAKARQEKLEKMTVLQREEFLRKERRAQERANRQYEKWSAEDERSRDYTGQQAGRRAADQVNLSRSNNGITPEDRRPIG